MRVVLLRNTRLRLSGVGLVMVTWNWPMASGCPLTPVIATAMEVPVRPCGADVVTRMGLPAVAVVVAIPPVRPMSWKLAPLELLYRPTRMAGGLGPA